MPAFHIGRRLPSLQTQTSSGDTGSPVKLPRANFTSSSLSTTPKVGRMNVTSSAVNVNGISDLTAEATEASGEPLKFNISIVNSKHNLVKTRLLDSDSGDKKVQKGRRNTISHVSSEGQRQPSVKKNTFLRRAASKLSLYLPHPQPTHATEYHPRLPHHNTQPSYPSPGATRPYMPRHHSPAVQAALRERGLLAPAKDLSEQEAEVDAKLDRLAQKKGLTREQEDDGEMSAARMVKEEWEVQNRVVHLCSDNPGSANDASNDDSAAATQCGTYPERLSSPDFCKAQRLADVPESRSSAPPTDLLVEQVAVSDGASQFPFEPEVLGCIPESNPDKPRFSISSPTQTCHEMHPRMETPSFPCATASTSTESPEGEMKFSMFFRWTSRSTSRSTQPSPSRHMGTSRSGRSTSREDSDKEPPSPAACPSLTTTTAEDIPSGPPSPFTPPFSASYGSTLSAGHGLGQGHTSWLKGQDNVFDRPPIIVESPVEDNTFILPGPSDDCVHNYPPIIIECPTNGEFDPPDDVVEQEHCISSLTATLQPTPHPHRRSHVMSTISVPNHGTDSRRHSTAPDEDQTSPKRGRRNLAKLTTTSLSNLRRSVVGNVSGRSRLLTTDVLRKSSIPVPLSPVPVASPRSPVSPTMHSAGSIMVETRCILDDESRRLSELAFMS